MVKQQQHQIKAIETAYKGYRFRSRLEARWAVFFDTLGIKWEYEKEGYDLGDGIRYLPDFWLPDHKYWIEIKPDAATNAEEDKADRLAQASGADVYIFDFGIRFNADGSQLPTATHFTPGRASMPYPCWNEAWFECQVCEKFDIGKADLSPLANMLAHEQCTLELLATCDASHDLPWSNVANRFRDMHFKPRLIDAYHKALGARFEFGENGGLR